MRATPAAMPGTFCAGMPGTFWWAPAPGWRALAGCLASPGSASRKPTPPPAVRGAESTDARQDDEDRETRRGGLHALQWPHLDDTMRNGARYFRDPANRVLQINRIDHCEACDRQVTAHEGPLDHLHARVIGISHLDGRPRHADECTRRSQSCILRMRCVAHGLSGPLIAGFVAVSDRLGAACNYRREGRRSCPGPAFAKSVKLDFGRLEYCEPSRLGSPIRFQAAKLSGGTRSCGSWATSSA